MGINEKILTYLSIHRKENKYRLARALKKDVWEATKALDALEQEGKIEMKGGIAILAKGRKPIAAKARKQKKKPSVKVKEEQPKEEAEETPPEKEEVEEQPEETEAKEETPAEEEPKEVSEETTKEKGEANEAEVQETFGVKTEEEKIEGTVKFFNSNKGYGFISGDDGKEYYLHEGELKEGITVEPGDKVSFKPAEGDKGLRAEEVEKISESAEEVEE